MPYEVDDDDGEQALDYNIQSRRWQYNVLSGGTVTAGANAMEVDVAAVDAVVNGGVVSHGGGTLTLSAADSNPRKDVIYIDQSSQLAVATGTPEPQDPAGVAPDKTARPAPPSLAGVTGTPLAWVWVGAGVSDVAAGDIHNIQIPGDLTGGRAEFEEAAIDAVDVASSLGLPVYADNTQALAEDSQVWFNDGSGSVAAGIYYYDGGVVGPLETGAGSAPGQLSGLGIDTDKDWAGYQFENVGHDGVRVPSAVDLTVDDFESGVLAGDFEGSTGEATVQSSVVAEGDFALQLDSPAGNFTQVARRSGVDTAFQKGDAVKGRVYLTDTDDKASVFFCVQDTTNLTGDSYWLEIRADNDSLRLHTRRNGADVTAPTVSVPLSDHLNEHIYIEVVLEQDGDITATLFDSNDAELGSVSNSETPHDSGGYGYGVYNANTSTTVYFDGWTITRRTREYLTETQQGVTELGNEVVLSGGINAGPHEAELDDSAVHAHVRTDDALAGGTDVELVDRDYGVGKDCVKGQADGAGGGYGWRKEQALGRVARLNANLSWEYRALTDADNWVTDTTESSFTFSLTGGRPRRIRVAHDGSGGGYGFARGLPLVTYESLGGFRITFKDVSFSENDGSNKTFLGITDQTSAVDLSGTGNGIYLKLHQDALAAVDSGTQSANSGSIIDWSVEHDISIEYEGSTAVALVDGDYYTSVGNFTTRADYHPVLWSTDGGGTSATETLEAEQVIVEAL